MVWKCKTGSSRFRSCFFVTLCGTVKPTKWVYITGLKLGDEDSELPDCVVCFHHSSSFFARIRSHHCCSVFCDGKNPTGWSWLLGWPLSCLQVKRRLLSAWISRLLLFSPKLDFDLSNQLRRRQHHSLTSEEQAWVRCSVGISHRCQDEVARRLCSAGWNLMLMVDVTQIQQCHRNS